MSDRNGDDGGQGGKYARMMAEYSTILLLLPSATLAGYWLGALLDAWWDSGPLMTVVGILAGAGVGFHQMYRIIMRRR
ncbi:MAG TPA: AtpZ/AtpI family protein [Acidobacteriota bacterium]|nr:AtpZ/AtpI family protein [Acidobacteriota bacterium]